MPHRAVLFDLDGTLLDTIEDLAAALNGVLRARGFPEHTAPAYRFMVGEGVHNLVWQALPRERRAAPGLVEAAVAEMGAAYGQAWAVRTRPYPGVDALLDALAARGIPMAVLTNKPEDFARLIVAALLPAWPLRPVVGARPDTPLKPDPAAALAIATTLDTPPAGCLFLGDSATDMRTALAAGMVPLGALWGFRGAQELTASGARALLREPLELLDYLDGWS